MIIVHAAEGERRGSSPHRPGGISFVSLLKGEEGSPDNFELAILDIGPEYHAPRHRHNFDQVRVMLTGDFEWAPGQPQREGTIGYFCEGTYYTQRGVGRNVTLLLQCGGAWGNGYMSARQLAAGIEELRRSGGTFQDGIYTWIDSEGRKHNRDAYQAVWEHVFGRPLVYPRPRFELPVIFDPANVVDVTVAPGVIERDMGRLNERGLAVKVLTITAQGQHRLDHRGHKVLLYTARGSGTANGQPFDTGSALMVEPHEAAVLRAATDTALYCFQLPAFPTRSEASSPDARHQAA
jgi:hypothetical protein